MRGGGADSIHLIETKIKGGVVLKNPNAVTRLEIKGNALDQVEADLIVDGDIAEIRLTSPTKVTIRSGKVGMMTVDEQAKGSQLMVENGAQVESLQSMAHRLRSLVRVSSRPYRPMRMT